MDPWYLEHLVCPRDHGTLTLEGNWLSCGQSHRFPVVAGVPVMLLDDVTQTIGIGRASIDAARRAANGDLAESPYYVSTVALTDEQRRGILQLAASGPRIDPVASYLVAATNGILYKDLVGQLGEYPIPELRLAGPGSTPARLLDVGCSWGRWSIAAGRKGFDVTGIDPSLGAVLAAQRVAASMGHSIRAVVGDARFLPFRGGDFDRVFSYSVLQHFSREDARSTMGEIARVLRTGGSALVQMPNRLGVRCLYHQARRGFRAPTAFDVRYWGIRELHGMFSEFIGPTEITVDGFFGLGLQRSDAGMMGRSQRGLLAVSEVLRAASCRIRPLRHFADSIYVQASRT